MNIEETNDSINVNIKNFFYNIERDISLENLENLLKKSWEEDPLSTLKIIFYIRDIREGMGEKNIFFQCLSWMIQNNLSQNILKNMHLIAEYGCYKDLFYFFNTSLEKDMISLFCNQLQKDFDLYYFSLDFSIDGNSPIIFFELSDHGFQKINISLASKWAPSEGNKIDVKFNAVKKFTNYLKISKRKYRKEYLVPLRNYNNIIETELCSKNYEEINYLKIPIIAMNKYKNIFEKKDPDRYTQYLLTKKERLLDEDNSVTKIYPYQIVDKFLYSKNLSQNQEDFFEKKLKDIILNCKNFNKSLSVIDVSNSMNTRPLNVAISLGLVVSQITLKPFQNKVITFSSNPEIFSIEESLSLKEKIMSIKNMTWGKNINLQNLFKLILETSILHNTPKDDIPEKIYIFSDLNFDIACEDISQINYEKIEKKYNKKGYTKPKIFFWNLRSNTVEIKNCENICIIEGFNISLLKIFLEEGYLTQEKIISNILNNKRYQDVTLSL